MSYFGWMVDIPTGALLFYIYCVDCISFYLIVFMLWCEYPLVKSFSCVSHPFSSVDGSHSSGTGFESITYYNSRGEGRDDNQMFFSVNVFMTLSQESGWKFLKIPHRSCLQKSEATLHEKYDDRPETHSNITWYWFERAPSTGWALKRTGGQQQQSFSICLTRSLVNNKTVKKLNLVLRASTACCSFVSCSSLRSSSTFVQRQSREFPWVLFHWSPSSSVI